MEPPFRKSAPWKPSVELSPRETRLLKVIKQRTLYGFLRKHRHALFDDGFQAEMTEMYTEVSGNLPSSPVLLAMVTLLQAYKGLSDHDAVVAAQTDLRWRLVLGLLESSACSSGRLSWRRRPETSATSRCASRSTRRRCSRLHGQPSGLGGRRGHLGPRRGA